MRFPKLFLFGVILVIGLAVIGIRFDSHLYQAASLFLIFFMALVMTVGVKPTVNDHRKRPFT